MKILRILKRGIAFLKTLPFLFIVLLIGARATTDEETAKAINEQLIKHND